jgi:hypothetical protein
MSKKTKGKRKLMDIASEWEEENQARDFVSINKLGDKSKDLVFTVIDEDPEEMNTDFGHTLRYNFLIKDVRYSLLTKAKTFALIYADHLEVGDKVKIWKQDKKWCIEYA